MGSAWLSVVSSPQDEFILRCLRSRPQSHNLALQRRDRSLPVLIPLPQRRVLHDCIVCFLFAPTSKGSTSGRIFLPRYVLVDLRGFGFPRSTRPNSVGLNSLLSIRCSAFSCCRSSARMGFVAIEHDLIRVDNVRRSGEFVMKCWVMGCVGRLTMSIM